MDIDEVLRTLNEHNFLSSFPDGFYPQNYATLDRSVSPSQNDSRHQDILHRSDSTDGLILQLKIKFQRFLYEHKDIVGRLYQSFYDELIIYSFKRLFGLSFNPVDFDRISRAINSFLHVNERDVQTIFLYFYDDLKPIILNSGYPLATWQRRLLQNTPKFVAYKVMLIWLQKKGVQFLTSILYPNQVNQSIAPSNTHSRQFWLLLTIIILLYILFVFGKTALAFMCIAAFTAVKFHFA